MRLNRSGQLLIPMLGLLLLFGIFLAGFIRQCRHQYWIMKMDVAAKATTLSAMRQQAEIMNTLATCQMANVLFAAKARFGATDYAYSTPPQRQLFEKWNKLMRIEERTAQRRIALLAFKLARINGADGAIVPLEKLDLKLQWMSLTFIHFTPKPPFVETEIRPQSFLAREWGKTTEKAQPDHKQGWYLCHEKDCGYAWATLWLDVRQDNRALNGGFPQADPSYFRSISFQCFFPQFNAALTAREPRL